ncbi:GNAT family N-acetyltransferase [Methylobacter luteus]|uniref:GNAT family N-acetyltransferase n=1 Tax=Methylobacter luteus TaxID=415 RepID=UPI000405ABF3|nr:GNAT family N-acetyltransferase [Methylobacter luteus]
MKVKPITSITQIDAGAWNRLVKDSYPFLRHEFLLALEQSGCASAQAGWSPHHLLVAQDHELLAFMPLYLKAHSRGEYVFDQQWAQAYQQYGFHYYPKWLTAIPFTPCQGPRIAVDESADAPAVMRLLLDFIKEQAEQNDISSWHCLFPDSGQAEWLRNLGLGLRESVQFHWFNKGYRDFDDFLQTFSAGKRKMIKRERRRVSEQDIELRRLNGREVSPAQWQAFFQFYTVTYLKNGMSPYLNPAFFEQLAATMGERLLLVLATKGGKYVGAALSVIGSDTLYGRYWGCYEEFSGLHFEACYYQGLEYCIEHGLKRFDSGAQGEHKIARGFEPVTTWSAHWLQDAAFAEAVEHFLAEERESMALYKQDAAMYLPFKKS